MNRCEHCRCDTPNIYNLCDDCRIASGAAERAAQGLPRYVEDPSTLAQIARLLRVRRAA